MMSSRVTRIVLAAALGAGLLGAGACAKPSAKAGPSFSGAAEQVYVPPGKYDEYYAFLSGGFSGQIAVYGLPSGRLFRVIPVFSQDPEKGWGYNEQTKPMLMTSYGFVPWDDAHHPSLSKTDAMNDGRWIFINGNNTPRIARVDLAEMDTKEIIEIPNSAGNHGRPSSPRAPSMSSGRPASACRPPRRTCRSRATRRTSPG